MSSVTISAGDAPVLHTADVAILGGSLAGVAAALRLRHAGLRVVLIEPRTYLGREITATLRPWVTLDRPEGLWANLLAHMGTPWVPGEIPLKMDALKLALEDVLLAAGVDLLYASLPVALQSGSEGIAGVVIANKSGQQVIAAPVLVDAIETALLVRLAGGEFEAPPPTTRFSRTLEFDRVARTRFGTIPVPPDLGITDGCVTLRQGYRDGLCFVTFALDLPGERSLAGAMEREITARHVSMRLAEFLIQRVPAFGEAVLGCAAYELSGRQVGQLRNGTGGPFTGPLPGLWCCNEAARVSDPAAFHDPVEAVRLGEQAAAAMLTEGHIISSQARTPRPGAVPGALVEMRTLESPRPGHPYARYSVPPAAIPSLTETDVLVVGGGTSGATAAVTAAREGVGVVLVEANPGLGGTGTIGGVNSYWYGRHAGFSARVEDWTAAVHRTLGYSKATWNIEAKMYALLREAVDAGVSVIWNAITFAALVDGANRVRGVVAATRWGPLAIPARVVIDATGDGDVAAFAGADFVYGAERDHTTMWYSLAQFSTPGRTRNNFTSSVEVSNIEDYTRAILAGRRRGSDVHDHGVYVAPRESRHILADVVLTHTDQLVLRQWPDVVNVHYSNHDVKGPSTSPWVRMGLIPPNLEIEVPYRAMIPRRLEAVIVTGKAISATHDALAAIRMQADMENLGGVAALAAVQSLRQGVQPREIDVAALQRRLVIEGLLSPEVLTRPAAPPCHDGHALQALVDAIDGAQPLYAYSDMEMGEIFSGRIPFVDVCTAGPKIIPLLEDALGTATGLRRIHLAQALAYYQSPAGVPVLVDEIARHLSGEALPTRENDIRHANYPPDQGAMPDVVYLLYSLGMAQDARSLPVFERVVDLIGAAEEDLRDRRKGTYYYVEAVAWGLEQLGDPAAIPILRRLHAIPAFRGQVCPAGFQADLFLERQALLEICIARAQARCGDPEGIQTLIAYLADARGVLAAGAYSHLVAITGRDQGRDAHAWES